MHDYTIRKTENGYVLSIATRDFTYGKEWVAESIDSLLSTIKRVVGQDAPKELAEAAKSGEAR